MGKGDLQIQKEKKPFEIKVTRDAEDVMSRPNYTRLMDRPMELDVVEVHEVKKTLNNPLVARELERRRKEDPENAMHNEIEYVTNTAPREMIDHAEKQWVYEGMLKLEQKQQEKHDIDAQAEELQKQAQAEKEIALSNELKKQEEELLQQDEEYKKQQEELKKQEEERKKEEEIKKAEERRAAEEKQKEEYNKRARLFIEDTWKVSGNRLEAHIPEKTILTLEYGKKFSSQLSDKKRLEKKNNPKSELFRKKNNALLLQDNLDRLSDQKYACTRDAIKDMNADISADDLNDVTQFMKAGQTLQNKELLRLFLSGKSTDGKLRTDDQHARFALIKMAQQLLNIDLTGLKVDTDRDIAANAPRLEDLTDKVAAFERLSAKYNFWQTLDQEQRTVLFLKLESLRSVAAYYTVRKNLMSNKYYIDHYDRELTMDATKATTDEQRALAENLVRSYILGKDMMRINGVRVKLQNKLKAPKLKNPAAKAAFDSIVNKYNQDNRQNISKLIRDTYAKSDMRTEETLEEKDNLVEDELNEAIVIHESEDLAVKEAKPGFAEDELKYLLTCDQLIPLKGTREFAAVSSSVQAMRAMMSNQLPPVKFDNTGKLDSASENAAKNEIDGTCIGIVMLYKRLGESIDKLLAKYGSGYSELSSMFKSLSDQCKTESEGFRDKMVQYRDLMRTDPEFAKGDHTWLDVAKFARGVFYDVDNDKDITVSKDGAGASIVYKITKKVAPTEDNPSGESIVYFREKDNVPAKELPTAVGQVLTKYEISKDDSDSINNEICNLYKNFPKIYLSIRTDVNNLKKKKASSESIGKTMLKRLDQKYGVELDLKSVDYKTFGEIIVDVVATLSKRCMAATMSEGARIDFGRNLSDRNVATSRMATLLGFQDCVCDSRTATVKMNGKVIVGNVMENANGESTCKTARSYSPKIISQLFTLNVFDFICGQTDRHFENFQALVNGGEYDHIRCIDNDMAFGRIAARDLDGETYNRIMPVTIGDLSCVPIETLNRILGLNRPLLEQVLGDILNDEEITYLMDRINCIKYKILSIPVNDRWTTYDEKTNRLKYHGTEDMFRLNQLYMIDKLYTKAQTQKKDMGLLSKFATNNVKKMMLTTQIKNLENKIIGENPQNNNDGGEAK